MNTCQTQGKATTVSWALCEVMVSLRDTGSSNGRNEDWRNEKWRLRQLGLRVKTLRRWREKKEWKKSVTFRLN